jgi:hypothetical protein
VLHPLAVQQFARIRNFAATRNQAKVPAFFHLGNLVFIGVSPQVIGQSRLSGCTHVEMQARRSQVRINQQNPPIFLPDERLRQIRRNKRLPFGGGAGNQNPFQGCAEATWGAANAKCGISRRQPSCPNAPNKRHTSIHLPRYLRAAFRKILEMRLAIGLSAARTSA